MVKKTLFFVALILLNCFFFFSSASASPEDMVIVIDAGHGGDDPGKVNKAGVKEKDINLAIAKKLCEELQSRGIRTVMTRESDMCLAEPGSTNKKRADMQKRVEIINSSDADYLISIHQNSYPESSVKGPQVFYYGESKKGKELAQKLQKGINSEVAIGNHREIKAGNNYYILKKSDCPGVIIECGFLTNYEECSRLCDDEYQTKLVKTIADAIVK